MLSLLFLSTVICAATASPYPSYKYSRSAAPTVKLDEATVTGVTINSTIEQFLGIPFTQPPYVGSCFCMFDSSTDISLF